MKIAIFVEKYGSAIHRLAEAIRINSEHLEIVVFPVHPKRNDLDTLQEAQRLLTWADIIDVHYWKTGEVLRTSFPIEFESKPKLVFHFNPYDLDKLNWQEIYNWAVVGNQAIQNQLHYTSLIPFGINLRFFKFNDEYTEEKIVNMTVSRIESNKGVLEVAQVCKELDYKMILVGRVSDDNYMREIVAAAGDT